MLAFATLLYNIDLSTIHRLPGAVNARLWKTKHINKISPLTASITAQEKYWHLFCLIERKRQKVLAG
jgi:hypothetical protein